MAQAKYNPPSAKTMGVEAFVETYWKDRSSNERHYGYADLVWFIRQEVNVTDIARAFGFKSTKPAADMVSLYREEQKRSRG